MYVYIYIFLLSNYSVKDNFYFLCDGAIRNVVEKNIILNKL